MPVNVYECLVLFDTNKMAGDTAGAVAQLHHILEKHHAEILASRFWAEPKLAYPIDGQKKGFYHLLCFKADAKELSNIEGDFRLNEVILRSLTLKIETKWVETMV